jgi:hypothetical protein
MGSYITSHGRSFSHVYCALNIIMTGSLHKWQTTASNTCMLYVGLREACTHLLNLAYIITKSACRHIFY